MNSAKFYDGYEKLKTVGQGAFGTAILYRRKEDGKQVVMKKVFLMDMDEAEKKASSNEVEILATLSHPNIIKYLGNFQKDESLVIIMEYADGGNLAQLINAKKNKNEVFREKSVLNIFTQMSSAIMYMHEHKILHRDLKTANIFLNVNGTVKIGDFGISKMLNTRSQAQTVVGTPYYLSPEMCEGYDYNEKSDIWAMGCILYELASLRKPFEALTLPVLVQKILLCEYKDIPDIYSDKLSQLVKSILQKDPSLRPSAKYIHDIVIPRISKQNKNQSFSTTNTQTSIRVNEIRGRSIVYRICDFGDEQKIIPLELPLKKIVDFDVSTTHQIIVTSDNFVYVWGNNDFGQLGIEGDNKNKTYATCVNSLTDKLIKKCAAGRGFSMFLSSEGTLYSCGDGRHGCLGHGDWNHLSKPTLISALTHNKIEQVCCGDEHVVALSNEGKVFTWGSSKSGQLGQGHMQQRCKPLAIKLEKATKIKKIYCGDQSTFLIATNGQVLVAGNNAYQKLGVSNQELIHLFTPVKNFKEKITSISAGPCHTIMLSENGTVFAMGSNSEDQLGKDNCITHRQHIETIKIENKISMVACGLNFSAAVDTQNVLWFWGTFSKNIKHLKDNVEAPNTLKTSNSVAPLVKYDETIILKGFSRTPTIDKLVTENIKIPQSILALYSSPDDLKRGNMIYFEDIKINDNTLFIILHTTVPPPVKQFTTGHELLKSNFFDQDENKITHAPSVMTDLPNRPR